MTAAKQKVCEMMSRNASLEEIEDAIEEFPDLGDDERAALWLLAWTARDMGIQGRVAQRARTTSDEEVPALT
jgi:hypothetical protein